MAAILIKPYKTCHKRSYTKLYTKLYVYVTKSKLLGAMTLFVNIIVANNVILGTSIHATP